MSLEGNISIVRLIELEFESVEIINGGQLRWPRRIGAQGMPEVDGVLALYDVMNQDSIKPMYDLLSKSSLKICNEPPSFFCNDSLQI